MRDLNYIYMLSQLLIAIFIVVALNGCATTPALLDNNSQGPQDSFSRVTVKDVSQMDDSDVIDANQLRGVYICPGDQIKLDVLDGEDFNGLYVVNAEGNLELPFLGSQHVGSKSASEVSVQLEDLLIKEQWFYKGFAQVSVSIVDLAPVQVSISGAVFMPGRVTINQKPIDLPEQVTQQLGGSYSLGRDLTAAITAAGGVRPDAKLDEVYIKRSEKYYQIDLTGLLTGESSVQSPNLIDGDEIIVRTSGVEDNHLIRPSQITPAGMRVFISNLTAPALDNANSAVGNDSTRLPYGVSLLDAAVTANCIGGTQSANAARSVILISRSFGTRQALVIEREIDQLLAHASDNQLNPFIMPNDAVTCYDSRFTNFRDVARGFAEILAPFFVAGAVF